MDYIYFVIGLALAQYFVFAILVGRARGKYGVAAPAVTGDEHFERYYRVQVNTLELLVMFVPALYVAAHYWPEQYMAGLGIVYLAGRVLYAKSYIAEPSSRVVGFLLSILPVLALLVAALVGSLLSLTA